MNELTDEFRSRKGNIALTIYMIETKTVSNKVSEMQYGTVHGFTNISF